MPHPTRPNLQHYLAAYPDDPARALTLYRAARAEWQSERALDIKPASRVPWRPLAVGACLLVAALLLMRALAGCSSPDPAPGDCAAACHDARPEGSRALLDCVAACSSLDADPTTGDR